MLRFIEIEFALVGLLLVATSPVWLFHTRALPYLGLPLIVISFVVASVVNWSWFGKSLKETKNGGK